MTIRLMRALKYHDSIHACGCVGCETHKLTHSYLKVEGILYKKDLIVLILKKVIYNTYLNNEILSILSFKKKATDPLPAKVTTET